MLGIDGATIRPAKSVSNVIRHSPRPLFIEYIRSDLKADTTVNVLAKIDDLITRLENETGLSKKSLCIY